MNNLFNVAIMTPVLHYTMSCLQIDPESRVIDGSSKPILGLFASGEVARGVHGANRLGGSSLLGCVVFSRVSGDSAAAYLLQATSAAVQKASGRLAAVAGHVDSKPAATEEKKPQEKAFGDASK
jgi:succinate dehydrogenase/fumarate reductase flavoprotein subunit